MFKFKKLFSFQCLDRVKHYSNSESKNVMIVRPEIDNRDASKSSRISSFRLKEAMGLVEG